MKHPAEVAYEMHSGQKINVLEYLKRHETMDMVVLAGSRKQYTVRIVAQRVDEETANLRR